MYLYTNLIIDVDVHPVTEYFPELTDVSLAITTKLEKSFLIFSLNEKSSHMNDPPANKSHIL